MAREVGFIPNTVNLISFLWNEGFILAFSVFFGYILVGTIFYVIYDQFGWKGGFEYAVSLGLVSILLKIFVYFVFIL